MLDRKQPAFFQQPGIVDQENSPDPVDELAAILLTGADSEKSYQEFTKRLGEIADFDWAALNIIDEKSGLFSIKHLLGSEVPGRLVNSVGVDNFRRLAIVGLITWDSFDWNSSNVLTNYGSKA